MHELIRFLVAILVPVVVVIIVWVLNNKFCPEETIKWIVNLIIYIAVIAIVVMKAAPFLGISL